MTPLQKEILVIEHNKQVEREKAEIEKAKKNADRKHPKSRRR